MKTARIEIINVLAFKVIETFGKTNNELDRNCWMIVHEYHHGVMPTEYDIREVEEELYLDVLQRVKELI